MTARTIAALVLLSAGCVMQGPSPFFQPQPPPPPQPTVQERLAAARQRHLELQRAAQEKQEQERTAAAAAAEERRKAAEEAERLKAEKAAALEREQAEAVAWFKAPPAPAEKVTTRQLAGDMVTLRARLAGKRVRIEGKPGSTALADGGVVFSVETSKDRGAACIWPASLKAKITKALAEVGHLSIAISGTVRQSVPDAAVSTVLVLDECDAPVVTKKKPPVRLVRLSAGTVTADYARNEVAAEEKYGNVMYEVAGTVVEINSDFIWLAGHARKHVIYCAISDYESMKPLAKGRTAVVRAVGGGYNRGDWRNGFIKGPMMTCEIVSPKAK